MLDVRTTNKFLPEKRYIFDILLSEYLGIEFNVTSGNEFKDYEIILPNNNSLIVEDHFFSSLSEDQGYIDKKNIPDIVTDFFVDKNQAGTLVNIFGRQFYSEETADRGKILRLGIDIFASSFFMLTRWEEYAIKERDTYGRFPFRNSLAFKFHFYDRPVVNEYIAFIWDCLQWLGYQNERQNKQYALYLTHDVDMFRRYDSTYKYLRALAGDIRLRKNPRQILNTTSDFIHIKLGKQKDNYDTFEELMDISDEYSVKSHFYFIPCIKGETNYDYDITSKEIGSTINNIIRRNHSVGLHASYFSYNASAIFSLELDRLREISGSISEGRQHFLRFENPVTWQIWNDNGLTSDSTLGIEDDTGFRCGTCFEFSVFNILTREKLMLKEYPLIAFEGTIKLKYPDPKDFFDHCLTLYRKVKKYNGKFVFLWHNNNVKHPDWERYFSYYREIIKIIST